MRMRVACVSGVLFWGTIGPPESDPATYKPESEPWFYQVRSDLPSQAVRRERNWGEAPGAGSSHQPTAEIAHPNTPTHGPLPL